MNVRVTRREKNYIKHRFRTQLISGTTWKIPITISELCSIRCIEDSKFSGAARQIRTKLSRLKFIGGDDIEVSLELIRELNEIETDMKSICDDRLG